MSKNINIPEDKLLEIQEACFKIEALANVLKLASATSYTVQLEDTEIASVCDVINNIASKLDIEIGGIL